MRWKCVGSGLRTRKGAIPLVPFLSHGWDARTDVKNLAEGECSVLSSSRLF